MWYEYNQNNSGGYYVGPEVIWIEANNLEDANRVAFQNEVYFNGCDDGTDCNCCGDRWNEPYDSEDEPKIFGITVKETMTKDDIIENIEQETNVWYSTKTIVVIWKTSKQKTFDFDADDIKRIKENKRKNSDKIWCCTWYVTWSKPDLFKAYQTVNYDKSKYWDDTGNKEGQIGWYVPDEYDTGSNKRYSFGSKSKSDVEKVHKIMSEWAEDIQEQMSYAHRDMEKVMKEM